MIFILLIILVVTLLYWKASKHYAFYTDQGVKQRKQVYLFGDHWKMFLQKESVYEAIVNMYNAFPNERYFGIYQMTLPTLVIRDPELLKQLTVKDFDHFLNHRAFIPEGVDPLWTRNLFALNDSEWRDMRSTLSPTFTSSKMKIMFTLISECADEFMAYFLKNGDTHVLEMKDTFTRYTNDVIASIAFGIKCNSLEDRENSFYTMGAKATRFGISTNIKIFLHTVAPNLSKLLGLTFFPADAMDFFFKVIKDTIHMRESQGIVRPDMLNLLLEARKGQKPSNVATNGADTGFTTVDESSVITERKPCKREISDVDIAAQALVFFFGGFDSVATLMTFSIYELMLHQDILKKLQREIDDTWEECGGKLTYEALMKMKYLDMILSETLRKWPAAVGVDRVCTKPYTIDPVRSGEKPVHIKAGEIIWIPINGIHYDEKYFPNPHEFKPERFSDENKNKIIPYTFIPFGIGPRNCIASRFALMETKTILFHMLSKFDVLVCPKTDIPIKLDKKSFQLRSENGIWAELKPRVKS